MSAGEHNPPSPRTSRWLQAKLDVGVDGNLVDELLGGVAKLPEKTPIRVAAEKRWKRNQSV